MVLRAIQPSALRAQLSGLAGSIREAEAPVVAFHAAAWDGPPALEVGNRTWQVRTCRSVLEVREALAVWDGANDALVILTDVSHADLGPDVTARLVKRRVFQVDAWEPVLRAFGAQRIDGRLTRLTWLADVLLSGTPPTGYPQVLSGTLDVPTAWKWAAQALVGVQVDEPDLRSLLEWTLDAGVLSRWAALDTEQSRELTRWLHSVIGPSADLLLALFDSGHGADAVPVGIVCGVLFDGQGEPGGLRGVAAVRLERWTGGMPVNSASGAPLATAVESLLGGMRVAGDGRVDTLLARGEELLRELGAETEAWRSRWVPRGFAQRLERFAAVLTAAQTDADAAATLNRGADALRELRRHDAATDQAERVGRAEHALRLVRYLRVAGKAARSFAAAVAQYAAHHAFADVARQSLYASETHQQLGTALAGVADAVARARDETNAEFARLAADWFQAPSSAEGLIIIEDVLATVVAPLATRGPVMLLVVDGMSAAAADSLSASIARRGWMQVVPAESPDRLAVIPALPSVTEVCRTSLFCGRLKRGTATDERGGFAAHPALVAVSKPSLPPVVFHKASLGAAAELEAEVVAAMANPDQRVVAAVVNAVDDHLLKDDMVRPTWTTEYVPAIGALCDAARAAGRALVVTADHGHVLDLRLTEKIPGNGADRYRAPGSPLHEGEVLVTGNRVLADGGRVVVAASERVRYTSRKNGYHGGISPQEMVVPLLLFAPDGALPEGYREATSARPRWWDIESQPGEPTEAVAVRGPARTRKKTGLPLFDSGSERSATVGPPADPWWLASLLRSAVLKGQRERVVRAAVSDDRLTTLLLTLASRGGRMTVAAVAERMGLPAARVTSTVAATAQLLNFDGYQVLFIEGHDVVLNETLLLTQFEIEREA